MLMSRSIVHLDLDAFFCAVEELRDPSLRGKAFAVGNHPDYRGVVASCSYPARAFGVRSAMPMSQALRLCPDLIVVQSHFGAYGDYSQQVMERLFEVTPLVEQLSIDEAFLDVSGMHSAAPDIARMLQRQINEALGLPVSLGLASNKLVAKIANNIGKARAGKSKAPNTITHIPAGQERAFLAPLPIRELWGVGPKTAEKLAQLGIQTIGDMADYDGQHLAQIFGKHGRDMYQRAQGIDERPVETEREMKSVSKETTFSRDEGRAAVLIKTLRKLSDQVGQRMRKKAVCGRTVTLKLRWSDFTTITRQMTLNEPTDNDDDIYTAALHLLEHYWPRGRPVRLIGVGVSALEEPRHQLSLWEDDSHERKRQLQQTLDILRGKFGDDIIQRGSQLDED